MIIEFADPKQPPVDRDNWMHIWGAAAVAATRCAKWSKKATFFVTAGEVRVGSAGRIKIRWGTRMWSDDGHAVQGLEATNGTSVAVA